MLYTFSQDEVLCNFIFFSKEGRKVGQLKTQTKKKKRVINFIRFAFLQKLDFVVRARAAWEELNIPEF